MLKNIKLKWYLVVWIISVVILFIADYISVQYGYINAIKSERNGTCVIDQISRNGPCGELCGVIIVLSLLNTSMNLTGPIPDSAKIVTRVYGDYLDLESYMRGEYNVGLLKVCHYDGSDPSIKYLFLGHLRLGVPGICASIVISIMLFMDLIVIGPALIMTLHSSIKSSKVTDEEQLVLKEDDDKDENNLII